MYFLKLGGMNFQAGREGPIGRANRPAEELLPERVDTEDCLYNKEKGGNKEEDMEEDAMGEKLTSR